MASAKNPAATIAALAALILLLVVVGVAAVDAAATCTTIRSNRNHKHRDNVKSLPLVHYSRLNHRNKGIAAAAVAHSKFYTPRYSLARSLAENGIEGLDVFNLPIKGNIWPVGGFFTQIFVGTPSQPQLVQIDTGSGDLLIAQKGCKGCPDTVHYDPSSSSTSQPINCGHDAFHCVSCGPKNQCQFNNTYQTCGSAFLDAFTVGGATAPSVGFGGIQLHSGAPDTEFSNMPGVWGMGFPKVAELWNSTAFDALVEAGQLSNVFSMCIDNAQGTGQLTVGGIDGSLYEGEILYTPIIFPKWYVIYMTDLSVNGVTLGLPSPMYNKIGGGTILDSGTNTLVVTEAAYEILFARFVEYCSSAQVPLVGVCGAGVEANATLFAGECFPMTSEDIAKFPSVEVTLRGVENAPFVLRGEDYLIQHPDLGAGTYCLGIQSSGLGGFTILGNVFQNPHYIVFDRANMRLGVARRSQNCY